MQVRTYTMAYPVFKLNISKPFTLPSPFLLWNSDCFDSTCNLKFGNIKPKVALTGLYLEPGWWGIQPPKISKMM